jgi:TP901 family phage tail tape measure protein
MKAIGFDIVLDDSKVVAAVRSLKAELGSISGVAKDIRVNVNKKDMAALRKQLRDSLNVKVNIGITDSKLKNLKDVGVQLNSGLAQAVQNMDLFLVKLREAEKLSRKVGSNLGSSGGGGSGGGGRTNNGSRAGIGDPGGSRSQLSAFSGFIRGGQSFTSQVGAYASGFGRLGLAIGLPIAAAASMVRAFGQAIGQINEFGARQAELAAVLGTTRDGIGQLTEQAKQLGSTMAFTAVEISGAQVELAKLGFTEEDILSSTEAVARFAVIAGAKIPDAAEAAGAAMLSFGLDATEMDRVISVMGVGTAKTALDFEKLKVGIGTTFATAKTFGLEIEDVTALLGELSNKGLSGSVAATATRNILLNLSDGAGKLRKTLAGLGVNEVKGLDGIVGALRALNNEGIDLATTFELTDKRSVNAFNTFLRGSGALVSLRDSLIDVSEEAKVMEQQRLNSLSGATILYQSAVERLNLTLGGATGTEGILQGVVMGFSDMINAISDLIELDPGEAVRRQGQAAVALLKSLQDSNISLALRKRIIAEINLSYGDLLDGLDLEKASYDDIADLIREVNDEYETKTENAKNSTEFQDSLKEEEEILKRQRDLIVQINKGLENRSIGEKVGDFFKNYADTFFGTNFTEKSNPDELNQKFKDQRSTTFGTIKSNIENTLNADVDQEAFLRKTRGVGLLSPGTDAAEAEVYIRKLDKIKESVSTIYEFGRKFSKDDYRGVGGDLSKVDKYLNYLNEIKKQETGIRQKVVIDEIKRVEKGVEDRRKPGNVNVIGKKGGGSGKADALEGSIDYLEEQYNNLIKKIESVPNEADRIFFQKKSEEAKVFLDQSRDLVKSRAKITEEEQLKSDKNLFEAQRIEADKNAKLLISDEKLLEKVITRNKLEEQLRGLSAEEKLLKAKFDKGLDKTGEYEAKKVEIEQKTEEIRLNNQGIGLRNFAVLKEMEYRENVKAAENIIKNEEDRKTYIELLTLQLSKFRIEQEKKFGKDFTDEQKKQLEDLEKQTQEKLVLLGTTYSGIAPEAANISGTGGRKSKADNVFIGAATKLGSGLLGKDNLKKEDYEKYQNDLKDLETQRLISIAQIEVELAGSDEDKKAKAEYELHKLRLGYQQELFDRKQSDLDKEKDKTAKMYDTIKQAAANVGKVLSSLFDYQRTEVDNRVESELESVDTVYQARLESAKGNEAETERIEKEYAAKKTAINKKAAEERKQIALKEAYIQLALGVIEAIPNVAAMAVAALIGGIQIAAIQKQKFKVGGFTPKGNGQPDETGSVPVGVVHNDEYVAPTKQIRKYPGLFRFLDSDRRKFASGGFTTGVPLGGMSMGMTEQQMNMMAEIIASRTAESVGNAAYSATYGGTKNGAKDGIIKVNRENASRSNSVKVNTF